ncbi:MAG TPA: hypothetical protein VEZ90_02130, partial [Blastocatellia bacterium]|nr:hypothetical protein [Blastocatellia bacterium]
MRGGLTFNRLCAAFLFFAVPIYGAGAIEFGCETRASRTAEVARTPGSPSQTIDPPGGKSPELPVKRVDTTVPDAAGATIRVKSGDDLQTALDKARPGDTILLEPGSVFTGNFRLQQKAGGGRLGNKPKWIIIETNLPGDRMPAPGKRLDPRHVSGLARVESNNSEPALRAVAGAGYYRLIAVELTIAPSVKANYGIVRLGEGNEANLNQLPHNMIIDRCYIHGSPDTELRRGVALNSADSAVINSYLSECHETGADSQAICSWNSPGPFEISNNYLEGSGENVMFGGSDPKIGGLVCSDITFSRNYCSK